MFLQRIKTISQKKSRGQVDPNHVSKINACPPAPYKIAMHLLSTHIIAINIAIRQHHGWVVLVHDLPGDFTHQARVCAVGHGERLSQFVQGLAAYRTVWVFRGTILFVTLSVSQESRPATYTGSFGKRRKFSTVTKSLFS